MSQQISRRQMIRMMAVGGAAIGVGFEGMRHMMADSANMSRVHDTRLLMGTLSTLTIASDKPDAARIAIGAAFTRMNQLEQTMSRYQRGSQLSQLNRTGSITSASSDLQLVMAKAINYGERTEGAFDVTVEPILEQYRLAAQKGQLPPTADIKRLESLVDYRDIRLHGDEITLQKTGMAVTLDGLAKGYILAAGARILVDHGFADVLVEAGGDLMAYGMTGSDGWQVGIQSPRATEMMSFIGTARVQNAALATSGDYQHQFLGTKHHHILDPKVGISPQLISSVTVVTSDASDADALSTALMVMGPEVGLDLIEQIPHTAAIIVDKSGSLYQSSKSSSLGFVSNL